MLHKIASAILPLLLVCAAAADEQAFPAHRIVDNVYYVGSDALATYLITTPEGHLLINSGFEETVPLIRASVESLGFRMTDVKVLLASHAHSDHVAGHARLQELTGAKVYVMRGDDGVIASGGEGQYLYTDSRWPPCKVDRVLEDGDKVELGGTTLVAHLTPGHTRGCTTWTWEATDGDKRCQVVVIGSPNVNPGYQLVGNSNYAGIAADFARTFAVLKKLPCDVFLGAHGNYYGMHAKYERLQKGGTNPFIDPDGYAAYVAEKEQAYLDTLAAQRARDVSDSNPEWRPLPLVADGRIAPGWTHLWGGGFTVLDGGVFRTACTDAGMGLLLYTAEKFGNCQIRVVFRCERESSNAGVYVRIGDGVLERRDDPLPLRERDAAGKLTRASIDRIEQSSDAEAEAWYPVHHGYEVQICDAGDAYHRTGAVYSLAPATAVSSKPGEWRTMVITLRDDLILVDVDGARVTSFDPRGPDVPDRKHWSEPKRDRPRPLVGYIGLQNHDPGDVVDFREVSVRPLPATETPAHIQKYLDRRDAARAVAIAAAEADIKSLAADPNPTGEIRQKLDVSRKELQRLQESAALHVRLPLPPQKDDVGTFEPADSRIKHSVDVLEVVDADDAIIRAWYLPPGETDPDEATFVDLWVHGVDTSEINPGSPAKLPQVFHVTGNEVFDTTCGKRSLPRVEPIEVQDR